MRNQNGFTLIELMITLAVLSILLGVGIPSFQDFIRNNRVTAQANELLSAMQVARSESIKRGMTTTVCASSNQATCSNSTNWATGWISFADLNMNDTLDAGTGNCLPDEDCMIRTSGALTGSNTLTAAASSSIQFLPTGLTALGAADTFTLTSDDCNQQQVRLISVTPQGRSTVQKANCP
jgi:type IV fimbrial biogenesis protein FimT